MRKFYLPLTLVVTMLASYCANSQDFSNKGRDFWVGYGYHQVMNAGNAQDMVLYFATDQVTNITITIPGIGYTQTLTSPAAPTVLPSAPIPKTFPDARLLGEGIYDKGIHITSDKPVVAYAHIYNSSVSGATILYPTNTLGKEYYSVNYTNNSNVTNANCWFYVLATDTGTTTVEIVPSATTLDPSHIPGVPFTVNLTQGQIYNVMGTTNGNNGVDLTGSTIKSIIVGDVTCKKIAVFSGSGRIAISCNGSAPSSDNYMVQALPKNAWGKHFLTVPTANYSSTNGTGLPLINNIYRVCVQNVSTNVTVNGAPIGVGLTNNFYYQIAVTDQPLKIDADQPIMVAQYLPSQSACGTGPGDGDPETIYLSPVEQSINTVRWNACHPFAINQLKHYINVIIPNGGTAISSFKLDGALVSPTIFSPHPSDPNYSYAVINVTGTNSGAGVPHTVQSDSGFNAIAYGYGNAESYGYNAGTNVKDLYQFIQVANPHATVNFPAVCQGQPFFLSIVFPYQPTEIFWNLSALGYLNVTQTNPVYDSTWFVNGRQVWRYKNPNNPYLLFATGSFAIQVTAQNPLGDGCNSEQVIDYNLESFPPPNASFTFTSNGCLTDSVHFFSNPSNTGGRPIINYYWSFGDAGTASIQNPSHLYSAPNTYLVKHSFITDVGCLADTTSQFVTISNPPVALFSVSPPTCVGQTVTFMDQSNSPPPTTILYWYWDFGDGSPMVTATNGNPQPHTYNTAGTYTVTLKVQTTSGCQSLVYSQQVNIAARPLANFTFGGVCLPNGSTQFTDQSTPAGTIASWSWNFGDGTPILTGSTAADQNPVHVYTSPGPFNVTLTVTSNNGCVKDTTKIMNQVFAQPHADFTMDSATSCSGNTVHFTDNSNAPGSTVSNYFWDFGDGTPPGSGPANPSHLYATPGPYTVKHWVTSAATCMSDTMPRTVTVVPLPTASFTVSSPLCQASTITFTSTSNANAGIINFYNWTINGVPQPGNTNPVITYTPLSAGNITVSLSITTNNGCTSQITQVINVNTKPVANFSFGGVCLPNGSTQFSDQSSPTPSSWTWNFGDGTPIVSGSTAAQQNPVHVYATTGPFNVTLTVTLNGCTDDTMKVMNQVFAQPHADFTMDSATSCSGSTVHFTDNSNAPGSTVSNYFWDFGDGTPPGSGPANPSHLYATPGSYAVKHWVTSAATCMSDTMPKTVTVVPLPTASFTVSSPLCQASTITFTSTSNANAGIINFYNWTINGVPQPGNTNPVITYTPSGSGNITVILSITTNNGCTSQLTQVVNVRPKPVASFTFGNACLPGGAMQFNSNSTISDGSQGSFIYAWNFGDGGTGNVQNPVHNYASTGPFNVTLTITSNNGCIDDTLRVVNTVYAQPQAAFNAPVEVCNGSAVNFTDQSTAPNNTVTGWTWNFGDGGTSSQQNPSHTYTAPGTFTVTLIVTSQAGCVSIPATKTVVINPLPTANFNASAPDCINQTITFSDISLPNAGNLVKWTWNFGDGGTSSQQNPQHTYVATGSYNVTLQVESSKGCVSTVFTKQVTISPKPVANFGIPESCLLDPYSQFTDSSTVSTGTITQWLWNFGDGGTSIQKNPQHTYTAVGPYNVTLTATSNNGCSSTITKPFFVNGAVPQPAFTVQGNTTFCSGGSISLTDNSSVNPGSVIKLEIYWDYTTDPTIKIVDDDPVPGRMYSHTYPAFGSPANRNVTIRYTVYSGQTCVEYKDLIITLQATPTIQFNAIPGLCKDAQAFQISQAAVVNGLPGTGIFSGPGVSPTGFFDPNVAGAGIHTIRYTYNANNGCSNYKDQTLEVFPVPNANAGPDKFMITGGQVILTPALNAGFPVTYLWTPPSYLDNPNSPTPKATPPVDITYTLKVTSDKGCSSSDDVFVKVLKAPLVPNIFSPNGDGVHDTWVIPYLSSYPGCTVDIYNRYGQLIYHSVGYDTPWDGTINGKQAPVGTYYYIIDPKNGRQKMAGYVDIIR